jgi:hypothetical protein
MPVDSESELNVNENSEVEKASSTVLRVVTWFSVGMVVAALGIYVGAELRNRYRFNKRTPYDFYSSSGEQQTGEFGVGV